MAFEDDVAEQRSALLRYARLQLRNDAWAEDAVSETLLAALSRPQAFAQRSALRTWLVGILRHKVIDQIRAHSREVSVSTDDEGEDLDAALFAADGHFAEPPAAWGDPEAAMNTRQFFDILEACTERLPPALGRVFLMREWLGLSVDDICKELGITSTHLYVQLHRARMRLRACLDVQWHGRPPAAGHDR